jgi:DNA-binding NtrC family response regulator
MTQPQSPTHLAQQIEELVVAYIDEARSIAQESLVRAFGGTPASQPKLSARARAKPENPSSRRSAEQMTDLAESLHRLVCAHPGEGMSMFARELGMRPRELHRSMSKLKADGKVRSVGERNLARYFPAVGRASRPCA